MHVIDLSDVSNPQEAFWYNSGGGYVNNFSVDGKYGYGDDAP